MPNHSIVGCILVMALALFACDGAKASSGKTLADDLELMCKAAVDESVRSATPDKRLEFWARVVQKGLATDKGKDLFKSMERTSPDNRCGAIYKAGKSEGVDWSCATLCPAMGAFGYDFLRDQQAVIAVGVVPTPDGVIIGMRGNAIIAPEGATLAELQSGAPFEGDVLPKPNKSGVLQLLGGANMPAATVIPLLRGAHDQGYGSVELIGYQFGLNAVIDGGWATYPSPLSIGGGFGGCPPGAGFGGRASAVPLLLTKGAASNVRVVLQKDGVTLVRDGAPIPPLPRCEGAAQQQPTVCLSIPEAEYVPARYDWVGLYNAVLGLEREGANLETVAVHVGPEVTTEVLVAALDVLRYERVSYDGIGSSKGETLKFAAELLDSTVVTTNQGRLPLVGQVTLQLVDETSVPAMPAPAPEGAQ